MNLINKALSSLFVASTAGVFLLGTAATSYLREANEDLPELTRILDYRPDTHTSIFDASGKEVFHFGTELREAIPISEVPGDLIAAFIASEDQNFWTHSGYDPVAIVRAAVKNAGSGAISSGASTITQQLVKNTLLSSERTVYRKVQEILLAAQLEKHLSKDEILERYLTEIYLGRGAYGVSMASQVYFGKSTDKLSLNEMAFIAGLPKAPSLYASNPVEGHHRKNYVLRRMFALNMISKDELDQYITERVNLEVAPDMAAKQSHYLQAALPDIKETIGSNFSGAEHFDVYLHQDPEIQAAAQRALQRGLSDYETSNRSWRGPGDLKDVEMPYDWQLATIVVSKGDLLANTGKVSLPISREAMQWVRNSDKQLLAGDLVLIEVIDGEAMLRQKPEVEGAIVAMDPKTGHVLALSGAFSEDESFFNRATMAKRQPGSILKPFIYAGALQDGWSPTSPILDTAIALDAGGSEGVWRPKDHGYSQSGFVTVRSGLVHSRNTVTLRLAQALGNERVGSLLTSFGAYDEALAHPSVALGTVETTLMNVMSAYSALATDGIPRRPKYVDKIDGAISESVSPIMEKEAISIVDDVTLAQIRSMLSGTVEYGTARRAFDGFDGEVYGKTGTTNEARDVWFVGFSENLVVGVFVGFDDPAGLGRGATGGSIAAPIVRNFFETIPRQFSTSSYELPIGAEYIAVDLETGLPRPGGYPEVVRTE